VISYCPVSGSRDLVNIDHLGKVNDQATRGPDQHLLSILYDAIDLKFSEFDCERSLRSFTGFVLAVVKPDFPFPPGAARQLDNGIFHSLVVHQIGPLIERTRT
jgi:hypothetical protein